MGDVSAGCRHVIDPGIEDRGAGASEAGVVAGDDRHAEHNRRGGDNQVRLREGMMQPFPFLDHEPPFEHHVLCDFQNFAGEHRPDLVGQPMM